MRRLFLLPILLLSFSISLCGCGGDSGGGGDDNSSKFVGTWALSQGGGTLWYIIFNDDGSWLISDTADGSARRVFGTYSVSGDTASGPMQNPGVGTGEIEAVLAGDDALSLDFVEFWHSPPKHVPYNGAKL